jgi:hypothetical protein
MAHVRRPAPSWLLALACCSVAALSGRGAGAGLDESDVVGTLSQIEKLAKLQDEGLGDMDEFMDSFELGQRATDDVKCDLCKHLMIDLHTAVSKLREGAAAAAAEDREQLRDVGIIERTEQNVLALCDQSAPRFLGLYRIHDCEDTREEEEEEEEEESAEKEAFCRPELLQQSGGAFVLTTAF